jgi:hypothetical protein
MFSSSALYSLYLLFLLKSKISIKHACDNFCIVIIYCVDYGKMLNLLFDTFHSTKYFQVLLCHAFCHFCVGDSTYLNAVKFLW